MKFFKPVFSIFIIAAFMLAPDTSQAQQVNNWTSEQLMPPALLAKNIRENKQLPIILALAQWH